MNLKSIKLPETVTRNKVVIERVLIAIAFAACFVGCWKKQVDRHPVAYKPPKPVLSKNVRVLLYDNVDHVTISSGGGFNVNDSLMILKGQFGDKSGNVDVTVDSGLIMIGDRKFGNGSVITPEASSLLNVNGNLYRGKIKLLTSDNGKTFRIINEVAMPEYLLGVVGAEMPSYWQPEALKAQTVAARTYCLYTKKRFGINRPWDVRRTQANQVYLGVSAETPTVRQAVESTRGLVLACRHRDGTTGIFPTYYSSTCGGHTESSYNVFGEYFPPLTGVKCDHCKKTAPKKYMSWGPLDFDKTEITARLIAQYPVLASLKAVKSIEPARVSDYGNGKRITSFRIIGENGKDGYLKAEDLRLTLDSTGTILKSTFCKVKNAKDKIRFDDGRGFGHGVGLCQYGVQALARQGKTYDEILSHYYPTAMISRLNHERF